MSNSEGTGPYVGWSYSQTPNPIITFYFAQNRTISSILIAVDNTGSPVLAPSAIKVDGVTIPFSPLAFEIVGTIALSGLSLNGNTHTIQLINNERQWVFVSEISFYYVGKYPLSTFMFVSLKGHVSCRTKLC